MAGFAQRFVAMELKNMPEAGLFVAESFFRLFQLGYVGGGRRVRDNDFYVGVELVGLAGDIVLLFLLGADDDDEFGFVVAKGGEVVVFADAGDAEVCGGEFVQA